MSSQFKMISLVHFCAKYKNNFNININKWLYFTSIHFHFLNHHFLLCNELPRKQSSRLLNVTASNTLLPTSDYSIAREYLCHLTLSHFLRNQLSSVASTLLQDVLQHLRGYSGWPPMSYVNSRCCRWYETLLAFSLQLHRSKPST